MINVSLIVSCVVVILAHFQVSADAETELLDQMRSLQLPSLDAQDHYSSYGLKHHYRFRSPRSIRFEDESKKSSSEAISASFGLGPDGITGSLSAASADDGEKTKFYGGGYGAPYYPPPHGYHQGPGIGAGFGQFGGGYYPPGGFGAGGASSSSAAASSSSSGIGVGGGGVPYLKPVSHSYPGGGGFYGGAGNPYGAGYGVGGYPGNYGAGYGVGGYPGNYGAGGYPGGYGAYYQPNYHPGGVGGFYGPGPYGFRKGENDGKDVKPELNKSNNDAGSKSTVTFKE